MAKKHEPAAVVREEAKKCERCDGCGKLDDREQKPWNRFQKQRNPDVARGLIQPINCPDCHATGRELSDEEKQDIVDTQKSGSVPVSEAPTLP